MGFGDEKYIWENFDTNTNTNSKTNTNTAVEYVALNGFVREKYLDKCFPRGALSSREEKETMLEQIQIQI